MTAGSRAIRLKPNQTQQSCFASYVAPLVVALLFVAALSISFIYEFHQNPAADHFPPGRTIPNIRTNRLPSVEIPAVEAVTVDTSNTKASQSIVELTPLEISPLEPYSKKKGSFDMHFIHIPKCGGTSMTAILRDVACKMDPLRNVDCCTNPGA